MRCFLTNRTQIKTWEFVRQSLSYGGFNTSKRALVWNVAWNHNRKHTFDQSIGKVHVKFVRWWLLRPLACKWAKSYHFSLNFAYSAFNASKRGLKWNVALNVTERWPLGSKHLQSAHEKPVTSLITLCNTVSQLQLPHRHWILSYTLKAFNSHAALQKHDASKNLI